MNYQKTLAQHRLVSFLYICYIQNNIEYYQDYHDYLQLCRVSTTTAQVLSPSCTPASVSRLSIIVNCAIKDDMIHYEYYFSSLLQSGSKQLVERMSGNRNSFNVVFLLSSNIQCAMITTRV